MVTPHVCKTPALTVTNGASIGSEGTSNGESWQADTTVAAARAAIASGRGAPPVMPSRRPHEPFHVLVWGDVSSLCGVHAAVVAPTRMSGRPARTRPILPSPQESLSSSADGNGMILATACGDIPQPPGSRRPRAVAVRCRTRSHRAHAAPCSCMRTVPSS